MLIGKRRLRSGIRKVMSSHFIADVLTLLYKLLDKGLIPQLKYIWQPYLPVMWDLEV